MKIDKLLILGLLFFGAYYLYDKSKKKPVEATSDKEDEVEEVTFEDVAKEYNSKRMGRTMFGRGFQEGGEEEETGSVAAARRAATRRKVVRRRRA